jgi:hypothetical protein
MFKRIFFLRYTYGLMIGNSGVHSWGPTAMNGSVATFKNFFSGLDLQNLVM